jgi:hypothetical protein
MRSVVMWDKNILVPMQGEKLKMFQHAFSVRFLILVRRLDVQ